MPRNHVTIWFQLGMVGDASSVAAHTGCSNGKGQAATAVLSSAWLGGKVILHQNLHHGFCFCSSFCHEYSERQRASPARYQRNARSTSSLQKVSPAEK